MSDRLLTLAETCERLSLSRGTVYALIRRGELPSLKIGRAHRVREADLDALIADRLAATSGTGGGAA